MPDKLPPPPGEDNGAGGEATDFSEIERGIDAVNVLRLEMRRTGMTDCADALDAAFAHCIRDFLALKRAARGTTETDPKE